MISERLREISAKIRALEIEARGVAVGKEYVIASEFNGQPYGCSKPSLRGETFTCKMIHIDGTNIQLWDGNWNHCYIPIEGVKFTEAAEKGVGGKEEGNEKADRG